MDAITRAVSSIQAINPQALSNATGGGNGVAAGTSFGDTLKQAIERVSEAQENSEQHVAAFLRGEDIELHQVMAAAEEAGIALEMLIEIRNKFTEAYRTVINMQS